MTKPMGKEPTKASMEPGLKASGRKTCKVNDPNLLSKPCVLLKENRRLGSRKVERRVNLRRRVQEREKKRPRDLHLGRQIQVCWGVAGQQDLWKGILAFYGLF